MVLNETVLLHIESCLLLALTPKILFPILLKSRSFQPFAIILSGKYFLDLSTAS